MKSSHYLVDAIDAALKAGEAVLEVYDSDFDVQTKEDKSPLTLADKKSHEIIKFCLSRHGLPFISEEGRGISFEMRRQWNVVWIVDPLDGTKEFIKRNGEFTVNIALIEKQRPVLGVVYAPVQHWLYFAARDIGAYKLTEVRSGLLGSGTQTAEDRLKVMVDVGAKLPMVQPQRNVYTIVGSRSHGTPELSAFVAQKEKEKGAVEFIAAGSSLKICLVAEGAADLYPRLGPTMEWDTAAGQAVAECAGARVLTYEGNESLHYNKENLLNPWFVVGR